MCICTQFQPTPGHTANTEDNRPGQRAKAPSWCSSTGFLSILLILSETVNLNFPLPSWFANSWAIWIKTYTVFTRTHLSFHLYKHIYYWQWLKVTRCGIRWPSPKEGECSEASMQVPSNEVIIAVKRKKKVYFLKLPFKEIHISLFLWKYGL